MICLLRPAVIARTAPQKTTLFEDARIGRTPTAGVDDPGVRP